MLRNIDCEHFYSIIVTMCPLQLPSILHLLPPPSPHVLHCLLRISTAAILAHALGAVGCLFARYGSTILTLVAKL